MSSTPQRSRGRASSVSVDDLSPGKSVTDVNLLFCVTPANIKAGYLNDILYRTPLFADVLSPPEQVCGMLNALGLLFWYTYSINSVLAQALLKLLLHPKPSQRPRASDVLDSHFHAFDASQANPTGVSDTTSMKIGSPPTRPLGKLKISPNTRRARAASQSNVSHYSNYADRRTSLLFTVKCVCSAVIVSCSIFRRRRKHKSWHTTKSVATCGGWPADDDVTGT